MRIPSRRGSAPSLARLGALGLMYFRIVFFFVLRILSWGNLRFRFGLLDIMIYDFPLRPWNLDFISFFFERR